MQKIIYTLSFWAVAAIILAQSSIQVFVYDQSTGEPVDAQTVILQHEPTGLQLDGLTNSKGVYTFKNIEFLKGYELLTAESPAYFQSAIDQIDVRSNENLYLELALFPRQGVDLSEVTVKAYSGRKINRKNAEVAFELKNEEIQALPIEGRDITRALYRLPNVAQATGFYPEAPNVSINGANSLFTSYMIDGMDNNERFLGGQKFAIPVGFTKDITVLTNNYSAEYGLTANGVIDITTKSGTNEFSGEAFAITRPGAVIDGNSQYPQRDLSGNFVKEGFQRYQAGVGFGGALVKDKTFYYVNVEHITDFKQNILNAPGLGVSENVNGTNQFTYLSAKLDHRWNNNFRTSLRVNQGFVTIENQGGGLSGGVLFPSAGFAQDRISTHVALKNTYTKDRMSVQTNIQYSRFNWDYGEPLAPADAPQVEVYGPDGLLQAIVGNPDFVFDELENTFQWQQKFAFYLGNHTLKIGGGIISSDHELFGGGSPEGDWAVQLTQSQLDDLRSRNLGSNFNYTDIPSDVEVLRYAVELRPNSFGARQTIYSLYLEDEWKVDDRLNVVAGLRYDYDNLSRGGGSSGDFNNLGPRLNLNYKLDERSSLRAGYGMFYDKIVYAIYSDALQQNTNSPHYLAQLKELIDQGVLPADTDLDKVTFEGNLIGTFQFADYLNPPDISQIQAQRDQVFGGERRILNPNGYQNPLTHQFSLGYQLQISEQELFFVDLMHNRSYNLFRLRNLNAAAPYPIDPDNVVVRSPEEADASRVTPIFFDENVGSHYAVVDGQRLFGAARNIMVTETEGESEYYAASFNYQKSRGEDNWALRLNYTLSQLRNNTEDINFRAMDANNFEAEWGPSINDRTHIINGIFTYYPLEGLEFTLASLLQSGQPINRIPDATEFGTVDLNGDGAGFGDAYVGNSDRYPGEDRNNDRLPWSTTLDLSASYQIPLGNQRVEVRADVFNVLNAQNLSGYSNNATQSNQIQAGSRASGRLVRRNASAPRQFQFSLRYLW